MPPPADTPKDPDGDCGAAILNRWRDAIALAPTEAEAAGIMRVMRLCYRAAWRQGKPPAEVLGELDPCDTISARETLWKN